LRVLKPVDAHDAGIQPEDDLLPAPDDGLSGPMPGRAGRRRLLRRRGITPRIARRGVESTTRLGRHRWKVERSLAWLLANRRLTVRYERRADILQGFLHLACAPICARRLHPL
jgi:Transposase DDE domain